MVNLTNYLSDVESDYAQVAKDLAETKELLKGDREYAGNRKRRKSNSYVPINELKGTKVGCNAIIRDYKVDHLICVDQRMVDEVLKYNTKIYTRADWISKYSNFENVTTVPKLIKQGTERWDEPFQWGSGPYAVLLSANAV